MCPKPHAGKSLLVLHHFKAAPVNLTEDPETDSCSFYTASLYVPHLRPKAVYSEKTMALRVLCFSLGSRFSPTACTFSAVWQGIHILRRWKAPAMQHSQRHVVLPEKQGPHQDTWPRREIFGECTRHGISQNTEKIKKIKPLLPS